MRLRLRAHRAARPRRTRTRPLRAWPPRSRSGTRANARPPRSNAARGYRDVIRIVGLRLEPRGDHAVQASGAACRAGLRRPRRAAASAGSADSRPRPPRRSPSAGSRRPARRRGHRLAPTNQASMRGSKVSPNTAARRMSARSSGASASIRAIAAASAESGRLADTARGDRRTQRGRAGTADCRRSAERQPPATCARQRSLVARQLRHPQRVRAPREARARSAVPRAWPGGEPDDRPRRATAMSHGAAVEPRPANSRTRRTPRPCNGRSRSRSARAREHAPRGTRATASCSFARPVLLGEDRRPRAWTRRSTSNATASSGSQGQRCGALVRDHLAERARSRCVGVLAPDPAARAAARATPRRRRRRVGLAHRVQLAKSRRLRRAVPRAGASCRRPARR